jgi:hypothetical protein
MLLLVLSDGHMCCSALVKMLSPPSELDLTHLYASMSAACRTGYVKSPAFNKESSISDSSLAFLETANRVCESYTCLVMVERCVGKSQVPSRSSSASAFRPVSDSSESKRVRHGSGPIRHVNGNPEKQRDVNLSPHLDGKQQIFGDLYQTQV